MQILPWMGQKQTIFNFILEEFLFSDMLVFTELMHSFSLH